MKLNYIAYFYTNLKNKIYNKTITKRTKPAQCLEKV